MQVTQILVSDRVIRFQADRRLKLDLGFLILPLTGMQYAKVIIWLSDIGVVADDRLEDGDGIIGTPLLGIDHRFQIARLHILRVFSQQRIHFLQRLRLFTLLE